VIRRTLDVQTASDAVRAARAEIAKLDAGIRSPGRTDVTLRELRDNLDAWTKGPTSTLKPRVAELYVTRLDQRVLPALGEQTRGTAVTPAAIRRMIERLTAAGLSGSTVCGCLNATSAMFKLGVRQGLNPIRGLERGDRPSARRKRQPRYIDRKQVGALLDQLGGEYRPVVATLAHTGLRISEALALTWEHIDFNAQSIAVPGTKSAASVRTVPVVAALEAELRMHRARQPGVGSALVFRTSGGRAHRRRNVLRAVYAAGDRVPGLNPEGLPKVGLHSLRHSLAAAMLEAGMPLPKVSAILGHADTGITAKVYAGLLESQTAELRADLEAALR
jgi:integrase